MTDLALDYTRCKTTALTQLAHIPGASGLPFLGYMPWMLYDFYGLFKNQYRRYGALSKLNIGYQRGVLLLGPDNFKNALLDTENNFSNLMGNLKTSGEWWGGSLLLRDFDNHKIHRRVFQTAFKTSAMQGYTSRINPLIEKALLDWRAEADFHFVPHIKRLLLRIAINVFYGVADLGSQINELSDAYITVVEKGLMSIVKANIPPFGYHYALKANAFLQGCIGDLIVEKRNGKGTDLMSHMAKEKADDGTYFSDADLICHLKFLLFAAHDTGTSALSHMAMYLAMDQTLQEQLREESRALNKAQIAFEDLDKLTLIDNVFKEVLRMHPPAVMMLRRTIRSCSIGGYSIPANTILFLIPGFNHMMEEWWDSPAEFRPHRFSAEYQEHKRHAFSFVPFGGGAHKCVGMNFAGMLVKAFMHQLLLRYRFSTPENHKPKFRVLPTPLPADRLPLTLRRL